MGKFHKTKNRTSNGRMSVLRTVMSVLRTVNVLKSSKSMLMSKGNYSN